MGSLAGRKLTERTEPVWLVLGAAGIAVAGLGIAFAPTFEVVLVALLIMGMSDGISIVAEQGIMMRRSPDAVRSRVMAGFDALLSLGIALAYVFAGPVLELARTQGRVRHRRCLRGGRGGAAAPDPAAASRRLRRSPAIEGVIAPPDIA